MGGRGGRPGEPGVCPAPGTGGRVCGCVQEAIHGGPFLPPPPTGRSAHVSPLCGGPASVLTSTCLQVSGCCPLASHSREGAGRAHVGTSLWTGTSGFAADPVQSWAEPESAPVGLSAPFSRWGSRGPEAVLTAQAPVAPTLKPGFPKLFTASDSGLLGRLSFQAGPGLWHQARPLGKAGPGLGGGQRKMTGTARGRRPVTGDKRGASERDAADSQPRGRGWGDGTACWQGGRRRGEETGKSQRSGKTPSRPGLHLLLPRERPRLRAPPLPPGGAPTAGAAEGQLSVPASSSPAQTEAASSDWPGPFQTPVLTSPQGPSPGPNPKEPGLIRRHSSSPDPEGWWEPGVPQTLGPPGGWGPLAHSRRESSAPAVRPRDPAQAPCAGVQGGARASRAWPRPLLCSPGPPGSGGGHPVGWQLSSGTLSATECSQGTGRGCPWTGLPSAVTSCRRGAHLALPSSVSPAQVLAAGSHPQGTGTPRALVAAVALPGPRGRERAACGLGSQMLPPPPVLPPPPGSGPAPQCPAAPPSGRAETRPGLHRALGRDSLRGHGWPTCPAPLLGPRGPADRRLLPAHQGVWSGLPNEPLTHTGSWRFLMRREISHSQHVPRTWPAPTGGSRALRSRLRSRVSFVGEETGPQRPGFCPRSQSLPSSWSGRGRPRGTVQAPSTWGGAPLPLTSVGPCCHPRGQVKGEEGRKNRPLEPAGSGEDPCRAGRLVPAPPARGQPRLRLRPAGVGSLLRVCPGWRPAWAGWWKPAGSSVAGVRPTQDDLEGSPPSGSPCGGGWFLPSTEAGFSSGRGGRRELRARALRQDGRRGLRPTAGWGYVPTPRPLDTPGSPSSRRVSPGPPQPQ